MARLVRRSFSVLCIYFVYFYPSAVISSYHDDTHPSIEKVSLHDIDGSYIQSQDSIKTVYHLQKRSSVYPPKKASASLEKKTNLKEFTHQLNKVKEELSNSAHENSSLPTEPSKDVDIHGKVGQDVSYNVTLSHPVDGNVTSNETHADANITTTLPLEDKHIAIGSSNKTVVSSTDVPIDVTKSTFVSPAPPALSTSVLSTTVAGEVLPTQPSNIANTTVDHHIYYNSTIYLESDKAMQFWVDFDSLPQDRVVVHQMLSASHRRAATVTLTFDFPFYGHPLRNITIATGGFVYMGDYMHSWLAATQYIAPLMANFDTSLSENSTVRYFDNGTAFVIEWHEVALQDKTRGGNFTFQATLMSNGNIVFVYKDVPLSVTQIGDDAHPVKVGLSDAYVIDKVIYFIRRKTIYEYHRINMKKEEIGNKTAIYFTALTTCLSFHDCSSCMGADVGLNCVWCEPARRCSDGLDRLRQDWLQAKCDVEKSSVNCSALPKPDVNPYVQPLTDSPSKPYIHYPHSLPPDHPHQGTAVPFLPDNNRLNPEGGASSSARVAEDSSSVNAGSVTAILVILAIVLGGLMWVGYAYKNPHTSSGQLLIRYRPSQWRFRSGEARYTAASIHM